MITANFVTNESGLMAGGFFSYNKEEIGQRVENPFLDRLVTESTEIGKLTADSIYSKVVNYALREAGRDNIHLAKKVEYGKAGRYKCVVLEGIEYREFAGFIHTRKF